MAEVADPGPAHRRPGDAAGPPVHGVLGRIPRHRPARPPRPLHPVDGELDAFRGEHGKPAEIDRVSFFFSLFPAAREGTGLCA